MKGLLALSSPDVFGTMFSFPQPKENLQSQGPGDLQIVPATGESRTLRTLLSSRFLRRKATAMTSQRLFLQPEIRMDIAGKVLMQTLLSHPMLVEKPLHMYALACHHGLHELVRVTTTNTLRFPVSKLPPSAELDYISGKDVYRLSEFRCHCVKRNLGLVFYHWHSLCLFGNLPSGSGCQIYLAQLTGT
jgi:hypothetical protein